MGVGPALCFRSTMDRQEGLSHSTVNFYRSLRHTRGAVMFAYSLCTAAAELIGMLLIAPQGKNSFGQAVHAIRVNQNSTTCILDHFGEHAVTRLHHRHFIGHSFEREDSLRLGIRSGHGEHVEAAHEVDFMHAIEHTAVAELMAQAPLLHLMLDAA